MHVFQIHLPASMHPPHHSMQVTSMVRACWTVCTCAQHCMYLGTSNHHDYTPAHFKMYIISYIYMDWSSLHAPVKIVWYNYILAGKTWKTRPIHVIDVVTDWSYALV